MAMIKGITITLYEKEIAGYDSFNAPIYEEVPVAVDNVLVGEPTQDDIVSEINLYGRRAQYILAVPKGDGHCWENVIVEFFGEKFKSFGLPIMGIEDNVPLDWNLKVMVERIE